MEKRISNPQKTSLSEMDAVSKKKPKQSTKEKVELQADNNDLLLFE